MGRLCFAAFLVIGLSASPGGAAPQVALETSVDTAQQRQALRKLSLCLAQTRQRWARRTLDQPYLSDSQASAAAEALIGKDNCAGDDEVEVTFRTSGLVGGLAEHFVKRDSTGLDPARLGGRLATATARNVTEDFAMCVASRNPAAARDMALSDPGSAAESAAGGLLAVHVEPCTNRGEQLAVDLQALRSLMAIALYRATTGPGSAP